MSKAADITLLEQALDALEYHTEQTRPLQKSSEAIAALRSKINDYHTRELIDGEEYVVL